MKRWATHPAIIVVLLVSLLLGCGSVFLAGKATRDWSLHWIAPQALVSGTSGNDYASGATPTGWDAVWTDNQGHAMLSRFKQNGTRAISDLRLAGSGTQFSLAYANGADVIAWRQDFNGGSELRVAVSKPGSLPFYRTLVAGTQPLEHPIVVAVPQGAIVLFSRQHPAFDVYFSRISLAGRVSSPRRLTQARSYALLPQAVIDTPGMFRLLWMDRTADGTAFNLLTARFSLAGAQIGKISHLDKIGGATGADHQSTPVRWGLTLARSGEDTWAAWSGDQGLMVATWRGARLVDSHVALPIAPSPAVALSLSAQKRELIWQQPTDTGSILYSVPLDTVGYPTAAPDRVAFEAAIDEQPTPVTVAGQPAVLWQSTPGSGSAVRLEVSQFSPQQLGPPNLWTRLGFGLANPFASLALLLVGGFTVGVLLTVGNLLLLLAMIALYLAGARVIQGRWRWYGYTALLAVALYLLIITLGAPYPPVIAFNAFSPGLGLMAIAGMTVFVLAISFTWLRRIDDVYRAAVMAFVALFFLAFLQALTIIQGAIGQV